LLHPQILSLEAVPFKGGRSRDELLEREAFDTLLEAKVLIERWRQHYNTIVVKMPKGVIRFKPDGTW
jgi:hypothetical protein